MMQRIAFRRRWAPWWLSLGAAIFLLPILYILWDEYFEAGRPKSSTEVRVTSALLAVFAYWLLAIAANWRIAIVTAKGVRVWFLPFPTLGGSWTPRNSIQCCYARRWVETDDSDSYVVADYYTAGIETRNGQQIDLDHPFPTEGEARAAASDAARLLKIEVRTVAADFSIPGLKVQIASWVAIALLAAYGGWR